MAFVASLELEGTDGSSALALFRGPSNFDGELELEGDGAALLALEELLGPASSYPLRIEDWRREWPAIRFSIVQLTKGPRARLAVAGAPTSPGPIPRDRVLEGPTSASREALLEAGLDADQVDALLEADRRTVL